jgi:hypothetical protein
MNDAQREAERLRGVVNSRGFRECKKALQGYENKLALAGMPEQPWIKRQLGRFSELQAKAKQKQSPSRRENSGKLI